MIRSPKLVHVLSVLALVVGHDAMLHAQEGTPQRISEFGRYEGYSEARFDEWVTNSRYLEMRDGIRLAVDITRPAIDGKPVEDPAPVVWTHSRYHRNPSALARLFAEGDAVPEIRSMVDARPDLQRLVQHGYIAVAVGVRGSGASFGRFDGLFAEAETRDAVEIIEWLASQPWCDGNVGMYGSSYLGITQYMAASHDPPALKAICPDVAAFDMYEVIHPGGVFREDMIRHWDELTKRLDTEWPAPPVDGDEEGVLMKRARAEHTDNWNTLAEYSAGRFRDHDTPSLAYDEHGPSAFFESIVDAEVPAYHFNAWYDVFVTDALLWFANYTGPQKLVIGAWAHGGVPDQNLMAERVRLMSVEQHRWFDHWLKGIENGVLDEPSIHYALMIDPGVWRWESADTWPIPEMDPTSYYFAAGPSSSVDSVNDGVLVTTAPADFDAHDAYRIDPTTTTGSSSRWDNAVGSAPVMQYPDLTPNDRKALTYTTPALERDVSVVGHPIVTLYVTSTAEDVNFHVLLEEVDEEGTARYVTEGVLRGSLRMTSEAPWNNLGLPFQRCFEEDQDPLPADEPTSLMMDLHPTATVFNAGHRIRVTIMGADADNTGEPAFEERPTIRVFRDRVHASRIVLPISE